jgi:autophagy-related protein 9
VLFYLGLFTSVLAVARGAIPPNTRAFSPEELLTEVVAHTHYLPDEWSDQMHSRNVSVENHD